MQLTNDTLKIVFGAFGSVLWFYIVYLLFKGNEDQNYFAIALQPGATLARSFALIPALKFFFVVGWPIIVFLVIKEKKPAEKKS